MSVICDINCYYALEPLDFINLKSKWIELHNESEAFRYKITTIQEKVNGRYLLQLNPDRCLKRRTPELIDNIKQPFDAGKFNFTKVSKKEILFTIAGNDNDTHTILVNASPISRYHSLFCPSVNKGLPQVVTYHSLELALSLLFSAQDRDLRIGFNSLCAFASVNHLHYHLLFEKATLAVETANIKQLKGELYVLEDSYPVPAFCFEVKKESSTVATKEIYRLIKYFLDNSIPHNILITNKRDATNFYTDLARIFIWARKSTSGVKDFTAFNVAVCELSGWFPIFREEAFSTLQSDDLENELKKWKIDCFSDLCDQIKMLY